MIAFVHATWDFMVLRGYVCVIYLQEGRATASEAKSSFTSGDLFNPEDWVAHMGVIAGGAYS